MQNYDIHKEYSLLNIRQRIGLVFMFYGIMIPALVYLSESAVVSAMMMILFFVGAVLWIPGEDD